MLVLGIYFAACLLGAAAATQPPVQPCDWRTSVYREHGASDDGYYYYDPRTCLFASPAMPRLAPDQNMTRDQFRQLVKKHLSCLGQWCADDEWKCPNNTQDCYQVEHIIPIANWIPDIKGCETSVFGNYAMAYGRWNQQLSNGYYGEKIAIYGEKTVLMAYTTIYKKCHGTEPTHDPAELCVKRGAPDADWGILDYGTILLVVGAVFFALVLVWVWKTLKVQPSIKPEEELKHIVV